MMEAFSGGRLASREVVDDVNDTTRVSDTTIPPVYMAEGSP